MEIKIGYIQHVCTCQPSIKFDKVNIKQVHHSRVIRVEIDNKFLWNKNIVVAK